MEAVAALVVEAAWEAAAVAAVGWTASALAAPAVAAAVAALEAAGFKKVAIADFFMLSSSEVFKTFVKTVTGGAGSLRVEAEMVRENEIVAAID